MDIIGFHVWDENQQSLGTVTDILTMTAQNIIVIKTGEKEILIPYVDAHIMLFDKKKKHLILKDVEGLIN